MEKFLPNIFFAIVLIVGIGYFAFNVRKLIRNIKLGKDIDRTDRKPERLKNMAKIALGQYKMVRRPVSGILHVIVYVGFLLINIEMLEIVIDGLFGTHRVFQPILGNTIYGFLIGNFEVLALLVFIAVVVFWFRRNIEKIKRFWSKEMTGWPKNDGNIILYFEMVLMSLFLIMNATDIDFQEAGAGNVISQFIAPWFSGYSVRSIAYYRKNILVVAYCRYLNFLKLFILF